MNILKQIILILALATQAAPAAMATDAIKQQAVAQDKKDLLPTGRKTALYVGAGASGALALASIGMSGFLTLASIVDVRKMLSSSSNRNSADDRRIANMAHTKEQRIFQWIVIVAGIGSSLAFGQLALFLYDKAQKTSVEEKK